ncbi:hypothetical protein HPSA_03310 [Helicobacter pylori SouthAfrica7]|uniref:Uncharacterized protein n=1 Tax=Helicobacter pylori (strain SouthAfrica7) TaxID=907239 RepID=E8QW40_HELPW|nr:hypothetical protein HPSA_03310 [Helicobacter pylori SouthAfrica7]
MKVTQGITNDFFALTNTIFSILVYHKGTTLGKKKIVKNYCKILSISLKIRKRILWVLSLYFQ